MSWLASFFLGEHEARPLQNSGRLTKDQVTQFFDASTQLFTDVNFKKLLVEGCQAGQRAQQLVDEAQARIWEEKVSPPVQGDFGIAQLANVLSQFQNDASFTSRFYQFVHLEERTLDEAEMAPEDFNAKYATLARVQQQMMAKMKDTEGMTDKQRQQYMSRVYEELVNQGLQMDEMAGAGGGGGAACGMMPTGGGPLPAPPPAPDAAPGVEDMGSRHTADMAR